MNATVMPQTPSPGDIGLVKVHGTEGRLIRLGQALNGDGYEDFEHAFVYVGGGELVEAEPAGARLSALGEYEPQAVVWLRCPPQYGQKVAAAARGLVGTSYGFLDYLALAAHRFHLPIPGLRGFIGDTRSLICSQLAVEAARRGGWDLFPNEWDGYVTPGMLWKRATITIEKGSA